MNANFLLVVDVPQGKTADQVCEEIASLLDWAGFRARLEETPWDLNDDEEGA